MPIQQLKNAIVILALIFNSHQLSAESSAPTGGDLLQSCQSYLSSGATQMQHMLCTWYILPCDCEQKEDSIPRVCLPAKVKEKELAQLMVKDLNVYQELLEEPAAVAANTILQSYYPCEDDN